MGTRKNEVDVMAIKGVYTEIYDMNTVSGAISALKFHTPQDGAPAAHLGGLFAQFRKYKYIGANVAVIPAQQLPLDPLQVSYEAGDGLADPRDVNNPILFKHWNGERTLLDLYIDGFFTSRTRGNKGIGGPMPAGIIAPESSPSGQSVDEVLIPNDELESRIAQSFYGNLLMDPSWRGAHIQQGLNLKLRPMVWNMVSTRPIGGGNPTQATGAISAAVGNALQVRATGPNPVTTTAQGATDLRSGRIMGFSQSGTTPMHHDDWQIMAAGMQRLGWLPTNPTFTTNAGAGTASGEAWSATSSGRRATEVTRIRIPMVYMQLMVLPPAYKQSFYFRLVVKHKFLFKNMTSLKAIDAIDAQAAYAAEAATFAPPTPASRLGAVAESTEYSAEEIHHSSLQTHGVEISPIATTFDYEEGVSEEWEDEELPVEELSIETIDQRIAQAIEDGKGQEV